MMLVGARVILACRDENKGKETVEILRKTLNEQIPVEFMKLDLSSFKSVREFAEQFCAS